MARSGHVESRSAETAAARLTGAAALRLHLTLAVGLAVCVTAFSIEILRALNGNTLSWMYVFEWPLFAGFGIYMWWHLLTGKDRVRRQPTRSPAAPAVNDEKLAAWNRYVRGLEELEKSQTDEPGPPT